MKDPDLDQTKFNGPTEESGETCGLSKLSLSAFTVSPKVGLANGLLTDPAG